MLIYIITNMNNFIITHGLKIKSIIIKEINKTFINLNINDRGMLSLYLYNLIIISSEYFTLNQSNKNYFNKLTENNFQDIYSFLVLLLPYFDLKKSSRITKLSDIIFNKKDFDKNSLEMKKKLCCELESFYYVDNNINKVEEYFEYMIELISDGFEKFSSKLYPNWVNIYPVTLNNLTNCLYYKNLLEFFEKSDFLLNNNRNWEINNISKEISIKSSDKKFYLGYHALYGTVTKFLYEDIKDIKWLIYDIYIPQKQFLNPYINAIIHVLKIKDIIKTSWEEKKNKNLFNKELSKFINNYEDEYIFISLLWYLRTIKNEKEKIDELELTETEKINTILTEEEYENDEKFDSKLNEIINNYNLKEIYIKIFKKVKPKDFYIFLYNSIAKFRYTWYGYMCIDDNLDIIIDNKIYIDKFKNIFGNDFRIVKNGKDIGYITLKVIYNYFKFLSHNKNNDKFQQVTKSGNWDSLTLKNKEDFISKINGKNIESWFNIKGNLKRVYTIYKEPNDINDINEGMAQTFKTKSIIPKVIINTLIINGMLSEIKYDPKMSNNMLMPNIDDSKARCKYFRKNLKIDNYLDSYNFLSNIKLKSNILGVECIKNRTPFTLFADDWLSQIQTFVVYSYKRILYITGATGVGKSVMQPGILLYAEKILNFNNNAKVFCSQPRIKPVIDNSSTSAINLGFPLIKDRNEQLDCIKKENIKLDVSKDINIGYDFVQYKYKGDGNIDNNYHPTLRFYTDGYLYNDIKQKYLFKDYIIKDNKLEYNEKNICDILLIDEAHEHNVYMDMMLTLAKYGSYINNKIVLGIISATMNEDEPRYRKFYEIIDDNWKYPLDVRYYSDSLNVVNKKIIDRRIHLSKPFGGTNYVIKQISKEKLDKKDELEIDKINERVINILKIILSEKYVGKSDILIFLPGRNEITKLIKIINEKFTEKSLLAIPFYKELDEDIKKDIIGNIAKDNVRYNITNPKNVTLGEKNYEEDSVPKGTYKRFIILATNIAEASITIDSLSYVIDTGLEKVSKYNYLTKDKVLEKEMISLPSAEQRKGRVGRKKQGYVYYTYDITKLKTSVTYKICVEDISEIIIKLLSEVETKLINKENDPSFCDLDKLVELIKDQYTFVDDNNEIVKYNNTSYIKGNNEIREQIKIFPFEDGKYDMKTLEDKDRVFYLIHPNENDPDMKNKIILISDYYIKKGYININNVFTDLGNKVVKFCEYFDNYNLTTDLGNIILDMVYNCKNMSDYVIRYLCVFIIIKNSNPNIKKYISRDYFSEKEPDYIKYYNILCMIKEELKDIIKSKEFKIDEEVMKEYKESEKVIKNVDYIMSCIFLINEYLLIDKKYKNITNEELKKQKENKLKRVKKNVIKQKKILNEIDNSLIIDENDEEIWKQFKRFCSNLEFNNKLIAPNDIFLLGEYEQLCYFILKNTPSNIFIKIFGTNNYVNYLSRNINNMFFVECINKKILTSLPSSYINYIIYSIKISNSALSNLMWIPTVSLNKVKKYTNILEITYCNEFKRKYCIDKYGDDFYEIYYNLSLIKNFIKSK